jgi:hypothetical protein
MKKHVVARRARNLELGQQDALNRCTFCRRELPAGYLILLTPSGGTLRYCGTGCREDHREAKFTLEGR